MQDAIYPVIGKQRCFPFYLTGDIKMNPYIKRICAGLLMFSTMIGTTLTAQPAESSAAAIRKGSITVDGDQIRTENVNGLTFKGFGLLSGNSTSDLLMDYKAEHPEAYARLLQYLFGGEYPIMNHVKLEMGNDRNNSTGPESSTKRSREEQANVRRNPGWQQMPGRSTPM